MSHNFTIKKHSKKKFKLVDEFPVKMPISQK